MARWGLSVEGFEVETTDGNWPVVVEVTTTKPEIRSFSFDREPYESNDPKAHANGAMNVIAALLGEEPDQPGSAS